jgi:hypothetical protein
MSMRRLGLSAQHFAVQVFILGIIIVCTIFLMLSNGILKKIDEESLVTDRFLIDWLSCKSDALAYLALPAHRSRDELASELKACDVLYARLADSPLIRAMRMLEGSEHPGTELDPSWSALRSGIEGLIDKPNTEGAGKADLAPALARASFMESAVEGRMELIAGFNEKQRGAISILQVTLLVAVLAFVALGIRITSRTY